MNTRQAFAASLKRVRKSRKLTQEDFSDVSSRTYLSSLERGTKSPTLEKIESLCQTLGVHPLTLLVLTYVAQDSKGEIKKVLDAVEAEIKTL
jgi:transcriptional regulator with XRE-family HTH domain